MDRFINQNFGRIVVVGSVAGDVGRKKNYTYGSAKAGLEVYCQGVQQRLFKYNEIDLNLIKPGIILTKMTADLELTSLLTTDLKRAGHLILKSIQKNKRVSYIPSYWKLIMLFN